MMLQLVIVLLAAVAAHADTQACGSSRPRDLTGLQGTFTSPNYPSNYPNSANCQWRITADTSDTTVRLEFDDFVTESGYDFVSFYDGPSTTSPQIRDRVSGGGPTATESSGNVMTVAFTSDSSVNEKGFSAKFTTEKACSSNGPRVVDASSDGIVTSPYFPSNYGGGMRCNWTIQADPNKVLSLDFEEFDIEDSETEDCRWDYVEVYDGNTLVGRYCNGFEPPTEIRSVSNEVKIFLRTDLAVELSGFKVNYTPLDSDGSPATTRATTPGSGSTTPVTGGPTGSTTTTTTEAPTTTQPPPTIPPPEGLYLEMAAYADVSSEDGSDTSSCVSVYQAGLTINLAYVIADINNKLGSEICEGVTDLIVVTGNTIVNSYGSEARVGIASFLSSSATRTFLEHHDCSREVVAYLADHANWDTPVIPTIPGCPVLQFEEPMFTVIGNGWSC